MSEDPTFAKCAMCGDFHFAESDSQYAKDHCLDCRAVADIVRTFVQQRDGSVIVVGGQMKVRTKRQLEDPEERRAWWSDKARHWRES